MVIGINIPPRDLTKAPQNGVYWIPPGDIQFFLSVTYGGWRMRPAHAHCHTPYAQPDRHARSAKCDKMSTTFGGCIRGNFRARLTTQLAAQLSRSRGSEVCFGSQKNVLKRPHRADDRAMIPRAFNTRKEGMRCGRQSTKTHKQDKSPAICAGLCCFVIRLQ